MDYKELWKSFQITYILYILDNLRKIVLFPMKLLIESIYHRFMNYEWNHEWNIPQFSLLSLIEIYRDNTFHYPFIRFLKTPWKILQSLFTRAKEHRGCTLNYDCRPRRRRELLSRREEKLAALVQRGRFVWPREARVSLPSLSRARDTRAAGIERLRLFIVSHLISARLIRSGSRGFIARSGSAVKRMAAINPPPCSLHCWSGTVDAPAP